jgi:class III poly(R)-hydroxyalkanoic acid synthase PhaE subunit
MAQTSTRPSGADGWFDASRKYWDAWQALWQQGVEAGPKAEPESAQTKGRSEAYQALMDQANLFVRMGEELAAAVRRSGDAFQADEQWRQVFQNPAWKLPFDTWSRTFSSTSLFPGDFLEQFKPEGWSAVTEDLHRNFRRFLSVPGLGYTREWQEQGQEFARLGLDYQRALQEYAALFQRLSLDAFDRMQRKLQELADANQPVSTLRGLYDVWVDASEAAYLELATTDIYAETYGRLVNALMALKRHGRTMVDETAGAMGMPTHQGFNTLQRRHQELRREVAGLRAQLAEANAGLEQVADLRKDVERLRSQVAGRRRRKTKGG